MPIYIIRAGDDGPVKIGRADDPSYRQRQLQQGCWLPLKIIRTLPGELRDESAMHERFAAQRISGEWFQFVPDMLRWTPAPLDPVAVPRRRKPRARNPVPAHIKALALELGYGDEALKKWGQRGFVPPIRRESIAVLAAQRGVTIGPADWSWTTALTDQRAGG